MLTKEECYRIYRSKDWEITRHQVLERDNYECQECKRKGKVFTNKSNNKKKRLDVDHIKELATHPELAFDMENLETLCIRCHNKKHNRWKYTKKENKWDDERW